MSAHAASTGAKLIGPLAVGGVVAVGLGMFGKLHDPTGIAVSVTGFSSLLTVKVWLTTAAAALAGVQLLS
ncbi:MAG TPA: DUF6529 family protein, partial [Micromonosporaceae bacterium]|nr:DUF6529 family protein [Micromonosporaceae bacterium]